MEVLGYAVGFLSLVLTGVGIVLAMQAVRNGRDMKQMYRNSQALIRETSAQTQEIIRETSAQAQEIIRETNAQTQALLAKMDERMERSFAKTEETQRYIADLIVSEGERTRRAVAR